MLAQENGNFLVQQTTYLDAKAERERAKKFMKQPRKKNDPRETSVSVKSFRPPPQPATPNELAFRHSNWKVKRALVLTGLQDAGIGPSSIDRFVNCGGEGIVDIDPDTLKLRVRGNYCHCRHCEPCMRSRSNLLSANLRNRLDADKKGDYRFITLTLKHSDAPLRAQIDRLYASYKKLRNKPLWKLTQKGGAVVLETKWKPATRRWHVHLHIVSDGSFLRTEKLSQMWHEATGDSWIVDIRPLTSAKDAAHYVAKYMSKGTNNEVWTDPAARVEWIKAMAGTRSCATFGTWRGFKLLESPKDDREWKTLGSLDEITRKAFQGDPWACGVLLALKNDVQYDPHKKRSHKIQLIE